VSSLVAMHEHVIGGFGTVLSRDCSRLGEDIERVGIAYGSSYFMGV
jgi:hypothetical protein